jgi:hypothetical protein
MPVNQRCNSIIFVFIVKTNKPTYYIYYGIIYILYIEQINSFGKTLQQNFKKLFSHKFNKVSPETEIHLQWC